MKKPILITCQPNDQYFIWQNHLYIESCLEAGFEEERIHILVYEPPGREYNSKQWDKLISTYPNVQFSFYGDKGIAPYLGLYIPILRPHLLWQHLEANPWLEKETIIYTDSDILWLKDLNINHLLNDSTCYISNASHYLDADYFQRKYDDALPHKKEALLKRDILKEVCDIVGIDKQIAVDNSKHNTGGVQYILKEMTPGMFKKIERDCIRIRKHLLKINQQYFENENKGFQSWCADLWAVLYNLWYFKKDVKVVPEMDFVWSTDVREKIEGKGIFHNAGIARKKFGDIPAFDKANYINASPFSDPYLIELYNNPENKKLANSYYVEKLVNLKNKYNLV